MIIKSANCSSDDENNLARSRGPYNSKRGMLNTFNGATFFLAANREVVEIPLKLVTMDITAA